MSSSYGGSARRTSDNDDRRRRTSLIPGPTSFKSSSTTADRQAPKKLSKLQPNNRTTASIANDSPRHAVNHGTLLNPPTTIRTPSLISGSSGSTTFESPRSNVLRRKPSTIGKYVAARSQASSVTYHATADDAVFGISMPTIVGTTSSPLTESKPAFPSQIERLQWNTAQPASLSSLGITTSDTPSTRFTESPFSHVEAPSSCSSVSPSLTTASRMQNFKDATAGDRQFAGTPHTQSSIGSVYRPSRSSYRSSFTPSLTEAAGKQLPPRTDSMSSRIQQSGSLLTSHEFGVRSSSRASLTSNASKQSKQSRVAITAKPRIPPELAHLNDSTSVRSPQGQSQLSRYEQLELAQQHSSL